MIGFKQMKIRYNEHPIKPEIIKPAIVPWPIIKSVMMFISFSLSAVSAWQAIAEFDFFFIIRSFMFSFHFATKNPVKEGSCLFARSTFKTECFHLDRAIFPENDFNSFTHDILLWLLGYLISRQVPILPIPTTVVVGFGFRSLLPHNYRLVSCHQHLCPFFPNVSLLSRSGFDHFFRRYHRSGPS